MTYREKQLRKNGPMFCDDPLCVGFCQREPLLAQKLQSEGIIAHYLGHSRLLGGEVFMLDGITPVLRPVIERRVATGTWDAK
jgi:hypothetical protein